MISEAVHRGETVFNIALRIDPNSLMRAAAFQLIRNVLHGCGTVIALRPEDNIAAANRGNRRSCSRHARSPKMQLAALQDSFDRFGSPRLNAPLRRKPPNTNCSVTYWKCKPKRRMPGPHERSRPICRSDSRRLKPPPPPSSKHLFESMPRASMR